MPNGPRTNVILDLTRNQQLGVLNLLRKATELFATDGRIYKTISQNVPSFFNSLANSAVFTVLLTYRTGKTLRIAKNTRFRGRRELHACIVFGYRRGRHRGPFLCH